MSDSDWSFSDLKHIDSVCDEFERAWNDGKSPRIEQYLASHHSLTRSQLLLSLLRVELGLRRVAGELPDFAEYLGRYRTDKTD
jgi:eukaryotic-like serine/threonine-protein kinase